MLPAIVRNVARSSGRPCPVLADTATIGAPARNVPRTVPATSSFTSSSQSASTRSVLVSTTRPLLICRSEQMARCSRVCGMTPSSAAITSIARSIPPTPASMFFTKRSCPGTSTTSFVSPSASSRNANPRSIVMPRAFSSGSRSVSTPVSARTSAVLPWSMCPAVPTTTCFIGSRRDQDDAIRSRVIPAAAPPPPSAPASAARCPRAAPCGNPAAGDRQRSCR